MACVREDVLHTIVATDRELKQLVSDFLTGDLNLEGSGSGGDDVGASVGGGERAHPLLSGWRYDTVGQHVLRFLQGQTSFHLDPDTHVAVFTDRS